MKVNTKMQNFKCLFAFDRVSRVSLLGFLATIKSFRQLLYVETLILNPLFANMKYNKSKGD